MSALQNVFLAHPRRDCLADWRGRRSLRMLSLPSQAQAGREMILVTVAQPPVRPRSTEARLRAVVEGEELRRRRGRVVSRTVPQARSLRDASPNAAELRRQRWLVSEARALLCDLPSRLERLSLARVRLLAIVAPRLPPQRLQLNRPGEERHAVNSTTRRRVRMQERLTRNSGDEMYPASPIAERLDVRCSHFPV